MTDIDEPQTRAAVRARRGSEPRSVRARLLRAVAPVTLMLAGVGVLVYPVAATLSNNYQQAQFAEHYGSTVSSLSTKVRTEALAKARDYNEKLGGTPILDPWLARVSADPFSPAYKAYVKELSAVDTMARLRVPSVGIDQPVYHGTSEETLARGIGHLYGTSLPVGSEGTHAVLTGHTGLTTATLFDHLRDVQRGDVFYIDVLGKTLAYKVDQIKVVLPDETKDLVSVPGEDYVTLMTCTPYGINSHRLLVRAHRIPYEPSSKAAAQPVNAGLTIEPWMAWALAGAAVGLGGVGVVAVTVIRGARRAARAASDETG